MHMKYISICAILFLTISIGCVTETHDKNEYSVNVTGLYEGTITLSQLKSMNSETFDAILVKSTGTEISGNYTGVRLIDILNELDITPDYISFLAKDDYMITLTKEEYYNGYLCYAEEGIQLTQETGGPIKLVIPDQPGKFWINWLKEIKLLDYSNALVVTGSTQVNIVLAPEDLARFQMKTIEAEFRGEMGTYTGVPLGAILDRARFLDDAESVEFVAADGYSIELTLEEAYSNEDIFISEDFRLIMSGYSSDFWVNDLRRIEVK